MSDTLTPFRHTAFRLLFAGRLVSFIGNAIAPVALAFAVLDLTGKAGDLGLVLAARTIPMLLFLLIGGVIADRLPRHLVVVGSNVVNAAVQATVATLVLADHASIGLLIALEAVSGIVSAFLFPAVAGLTPQTVPTALLQQANALLRLGLNGAMIGGSALAGVLVATVGPGWGLAVDAVAYAAGAVVLAFVRVQRDQLTRREASSSTFAELREGWTEFSSRTWIWVVVAQFSLVNAALTCGFVTLGPVVADSTFGRAAWGIVLAAQTAGMLAGGLLALRMRPARPLFLGTAAMLLVVPGLLVLAWEPRAVPLVIAAFIAGLGIETFGVYWDLSLQQNVPLDRLSRVYSYDALGSFVFMPVGQILAGPLSIAFGVPATVAGAGFVIGVATLAALAVPAVRDLRRVEQPDRSPSASVAA